MPTMKRTGLLLILMALGAPVCGAGADIDLHAYWDQRCKDCHGHASDFARRFLRVENGRLLGTHHRNELEVFLRNHYLSDELVAPVMTMLAAQRTTPALFRERCAHCHGNAADFARRSLTLRDGALVGLPSGRKVVDTLGTHGGAKPAEVPVLLDTLARVRSEVAPSRP